LGGFFVIVALIDAYGIDPKLANILCPPEAPKSFEEIVRDQSAVIIDDNFGLIGLRTPHI